MTYEGFEALSNFKGKDFHHYPSERQRGTWLWEVGVKTGNGIEPNSPQERLTGSVGCFHVNYETWNTYNLLVDGAVNTTHADAERSLVAESSAELHLL